MTGLFRAGDRVQLTGHKGRRNTITLAAGERFGMIRFGSRLDVYLPEGVAPLVCLGQGMIAGETVLADLASAEPARRGEAR